MEEKELLSLVQQFLSTSEGEKLIKEVGIEVDIESINRKIAALDKDLSREERQERRRNRRSSRAEERKNRREQRKEEIQKLRAKLKSNIPVLKTFQVKGRLFDKNSGNPIEGVKIKALKGIIDKPKELKPITDETGVFNINLKLPVLPSVVSIDIKDEEGNNIIKEFTFRANDIALLNPSLIYTKQGYAPSTQGIVNLDNTVKTDLKTFSLLNIKLEAKKVSDDIKNTINDNVEKINNLALDLPQKIIVARRKQIMNLVNAVNSKLLPILIGLLITFGITKLSQKSQKVCPTPDTLKNNVKKRNRVVRQLNQIYASLVLNTALAAIFIATAKLLKNIKRQLIGLPFPVAPGGGLPGIPYSTIAKLQDVKDTIDTLAEQNKDLNRQTIIALVYLVAVLIAILILLRGLDELTQECAGELDLEFEEINEELQDLTEEQAEEGFPLVTEVNGFTMGIELEKNTVGSLTRRYATATNKQGIVQLKGEPSFSATDQILIDELAFYITSNNLKAF